MFDNTPETEAFVESDDEVVTVLRRAAQYIREFGFSPSLGKHGCPRCMIGAVHSIAGERDDYLEILSQAARTIEAALGASCIAHYVYAEGRTASEVIDALERAALHRARSLKTGV